MFEILLYLLIIISIITTECTSENSGLSQSSQLWIYPNIKINPSKIINTPELAICSNSTSIFRLLTEIHISSAPLDIFIIASNLSHFQFVLETFSNFSQKPRVFIQVPYLNLNLDKIKFPKIDSEIFFFASNNGTLWEFYQHKNLFVGQLLGQFISKGKEFHELGNVMLNPISVRRRNLTGLSINAVAQYDPDYEPRINSLVHENGSVTFVSGMCLDVLRELQYMLNFSFTALDGQGWLGIFPNGSWTGMSDQVHSGQADLSISQASMIMMTDQSHGIKFLHSTSYGVLVAIFKQPHASTIRDIILSVFSPYLWGCYLLLWIIVLGLLGTSWRILEKFKSFDSKGREEDEEFVRDSIWWAISSTCILSWHSIPHSFTIRLIFTLGFFLSFLMYIGYCASMVTNLSNEYVAVRSLSDLVSSSAFGIFADMYLPMAQHVMRDIYHQRSERLDQYQHLFQLESVVPKLLNSSWAFVTFAEAISLVFHRLRYSDVFFCDNIHSLPVAKYPNAMFVKRGEPLVEIFNGKLLMLIERGISSRMNRIYDSKTQISCAQDPQLYRGGLALNDVTTPFLFVAAGILSSFGIFGVEKKRRK